MQSSHAKAGPNLATSTEREPVASEDAVVLFDGVCNLCNAGVDFIIKRDPQARFKFAALQSLVAAELLQKLQIPRSLDTFVLLKGARAYARSTAVLRVLRRLSAPWPVLYALVVLPAPLRDSAYALIARWRYRIFGRRVSCRVPSPDEEHRFIRG